MVRYDGYMHLSGTHHSKQNLVSPHAVACYPAIPQSSPKINDLLTFKCLKITKSSKYNSLNPGNLIHQFHLQNQQWAAAVPAPVVASPHARRPDTTRHVIPSPKIPPIYHVSCSQSSFSHPNSCTRAPYDFKSEVDRNSGVIAITKEPVLWGPNMENITPRVGTRTTDQTLYCAAAGGHLADVKRLLESGVNPSDRTVCDWCPLVSSRNASPFPSALPSNAKLTRWQTSTGQPTTTSPTATKS